MKHLYLRIILPVLLLTIVSNFSNAQTGAQKKINITLPNCREIMKLSFLKDWNGGFYHGNHFPRFSEERVIACSEYRKGKSKILVTVLGRSKDAKNDYYYGQFRVGVMDIDSITIERWKTEYNQDVDTEYTKNIEAVQKLKYDDPLMKHGDTLGKKSIDGWKRFVDGWNKTVDSMVSKKVFPVIVKMYQNEFFCRIEHDHIINCGYVSMTPFKFDKYKAKFYVIMEYFNTSIKEMREIVKSFPFEDLKRVFRD